MWYIGFHKGNKYQEMVLFYLLFIDVDDLHEGIEEDTDSIKHIVCCITQEIVAEKRIDTKIYLTTETYALSLGP